MSVGGASKVELPLHAAREWRFVTSNWVPAPRIYEDARGAMESQVGRLDS